MTTFRQSPEHQRLGITLRMLRLTHAISQEELGYRSDLHRNYVGALERGEINPTFGTLLRLATGLDIPLSQIITTWENPPPDLQRHTTRRRGF